MHIGDSTDYKSNEKCADIRGDGYFTCTTPLNGKYVTFHGNGDSINDVNVYSCFITFKAFPSKNLIEDATLIHEPISVNDSTKLSFRTYMSRLNPRGSIIANNNSITTQTCSKYPWGSDDSNTVRWFAFDLNADYSIEYVHTSGESDDG